MKKTIAILLVVLSVLCTSCEPAGQATTTTLDTLDTTVEDTITCDTLPLDTTATTLEETSITTTKATTTTTTTTTQPPTTTETEAETSTVQSESKVFLTPEELIEDLSNAEYVGFDFIFNAAEYMTSRQEEADIIVEYLKDATFTPCDKLGFNKLKMDVISVMYNGHEFWLYRPYDVSLPEYGKCIMNLINYGSDAGMPLYYEVGIDSVDALFDDFYNDFYNAERVKVSSTLAEEDSQKFQTTTEATTTTTEVTTVIEQSTDTIQATVQPPQTLEDMIESDGRVYITHTEDGYNYTKLRNSFNLECIRQYLEGVTYIPSSDTSEMLYASSNVRQITILWDSTNRNDDSAYVETLTIYYLGEQFSWVGNCVIDVMLDDLADFKGGDYQASYTAYIPDVDALFEAIDNM